MLSSYRLILISALLPLLQMRFFSALLVLSVPACASLQQTSSAGGFPAGTAELVAEGTLSTAANEYNPSLSPDGRTLVFARSEPEFRNARILVSHLRDGRWSPAQPIVFTDPRYSDTDPTFSPDGNTLYFISNRPAPDRDSARADLDIWRVRRVQGGWGTPEHLGDAVNSRAQELGPTWHAGSLYFASSRGGRARMLDIYRSREGATGFGPAEALDGVNTEASDSDPEFSRDGQTLLFWSDRAGGRGQADVYASRRTAEGWSTARLLEGEINSSGFDFTPSFSPDGGWIYFASMRQDSTGNPVVHNGQSNLYRISSGSALP
jgi:Tol biopolymer transport system component